MSRQSFPQLYANKVNDVKRSSEVNLEYRIDIFVDDGENRRGMALNFHGFPKQEEYGQQGKTRDTR